MTQSVGSATGIQTFEIYFSDSLKEKMYTALVKVAPGSSTIEWNVLLHGIPIADLHGKEVVVNWQVADFANSGVFYTDSNGLEMQKRVLNYREDFDLVTDEHVSANYYPINAAIVVKDDKKQFTVQNDRSQGGSSLADGNIEIMQNRRLLKDDWRGVGEALNEMNSKGVGIEVDATYYTSLVDLEAGEVSE